VNDRVGVPALMDTIEGGAGSKLRARLVRSGASGYQDPEIFDRVRAVLQRAADERDPAALLLPDILGSDEEWALDPNLRLSSHRRRSGGAILFAKRRILLPLTRWLFEYTRENFRRQERINRMLMACVEALALENARLRRDLDALAPRR
jgi:hypothetical protein